MLEVTEREDGAEITVVYGTSQKVDRLSTGKFVITRLSHAAAYKSAGLSSATQFDFRQTVALPWNESFFSVPPGAPHGQRPQLGFLHASMMTAAAAAHAAASRR